LSDIIADMDKEMDKERDLKRFLDRFSGQKKVLEDTGSEFIEMNEEDRIRALTEFAEEFGKDLTINMTELITELAQIESEDFEEFIKKASEIIQPEPRIDFPHPTKDLKL